MKVIGITGGVACGKTTATHFLQEQSYPVIDADTIVAQLYEQQEVAQQIMDIFGTCEKPKIRKIIFQNPEKRKKLENLLHPLVGKQIQKQIEKLQDKEHPITFVSVPLLFETQMEKMFDHVIVIACKAQKQIERLTQRDQISEDQAKKIIEAQMPLDEKRKRADFVIENNSSKESLLESLQQMITKLL